VEESFGCTEIAAVGLASSVAYNAAKGKLPDRLMSRLKQYREIVNPKIEKIELRVDRNVYKNSLAVGFLVQKICMEFIIQQHWVFFVILI